MNQDIKNWPASISRRILNESKRRGRPNSEILQYFGMERFLYRLSKTEYRDSFILKGGLIFHGWELPLRRPTKDIDFLGFLENKKEIIEKVIKTAMSVSVPEDGMYYDPESISISETQVDADRKGLQAKFLGFLGKIQISMRIDFGFSDELNSNPSPINFPTVLDGMPRPQLMSYPLESVVAEKFHAMVRYASIPSRWKDYYDIWLISEHFEFDVESLRAAIVRTFESRSTAVPSSRPSSLTIEFASKHQKAWKTFLQKDRLENDEINDLSAAIEKIWVFLEHPIIRSKALIGRKGTVHWSPVRHTWK